MRKITHFLYWTKNWINYPMKFHSVFFLFAFLLKVIYKFLCLSVSHMSCSGSLEYWGAETLFYTILPVFSLVFCVAENSRTAFRSLNTSLNPAQFWINQCSPVLYPTTINALINKERICVRDRRLHHSGNNL